MTTNLHEVVLAGGHVVVVGVEQLAVLLKELLGVVNCALDQGYQPINMIYFCKNMCTNGLQQVKRYLT